MLKKIILTGIVAILAACVVVWQRGDEAVAVSQSGSSDVDVDLTRLSSTMIYAEVFNMLADPASYIGKSVRMSGRFVAYAGKDEGKYYPAVIIPDATACCAQGIEFVLEGDPSYPEGYPQLESDIVVVGTFETYEEETMLFCRLANAAVE